MPRTGIFVSYSHKDASWLNRLQVHLKPLESRYEMRLWDDTRIRPGDQWMLEIRRAIASARAVILLVSADFLASDFISRHELPDLLRKAEEEGARILPLIIGACLFEETKSLSRYQAVNSIQSPLDRLSDGEINQTLLTLAREVQTFLEAADVGSPPPGMVRQAAPLVSVSAPPVGVVPSSGMRRALIVEFQEYADPGFNSLLRQRTPRPDLARLTAVLEDPKIGKYSVETLTNPSANTLRQSVARFYKACSVDDVALVYLFGLGMTDNADNLWVVAHDSVFGDTESGVSLKPLQNALTGSKSNQQIVVFDCRYVGVFPAQSAARPIGPVPGLQGEGRFIISTTNAISWVQDETARGCKLIDLRANAFFDHVVKGLVEGEADLDRSRKITINEIKTYVLNALRAELPDADPDDLPTTWAFDTSRADLVVVADSALQGEDKLPTQRRQRYTVSQNIRRPIFDLIVPAYLLDDRYYILDWNPAFDTLVARSLKLCRGTSHAGVFVRELVNREQTIKHSNDRFNESSVPLVDTEELIFDTGRFGEPFGKIWFQKLAAQITDAEGRTMGWSVSLNIKKVEFHEAELWELLMSRIQTEVGWGRYAVVYDNLLLEFDEYRALVKRVCDQVGSALLCADLGAGTGNGSIRLLETNPDREVYAVEINETMLRHFKAKLQARMREENVDDSDRLTFVKDDVTRLDSLPANSFDAAIMINVLYAVDDRVECLRNVNRILKLDGILSLSTSHRDTDVDRLFNGLQNALADKGLLDQYQQQVEVARARHEEMSELIHRDTADTTVAMLREAGFELVGEPRTAYLGAVIVVKARKVRDVVPRERKPLSPPAATPAVAATTSSFDVFISYCKEDQSIADQIIRALEDQAIRCWIAPRDLQPSSRWIEKIVEAITGCRVMIVILSSHASQSSMVVDEVATATRLGRPVMPFRVDDVEPSSSLAFFLATVHWLDAFPPPIDQHFPRLVNSVKFLLTTAAGSEGSTASH